MDRNAKIGGVARDWIIRQLTLGEFDSRRHVWHKAVVMACKISALAYGINLVAHLGLYWLDLLPFPLSAGLIAATILTPTIAFSVALAVYVVLGFAIYELGVSRAELEHLSRTDMFVGPGQPQGVSGEFRPVQSRQVADGDRHRPVQIRQ